MSGETSDRHDPKLRHGIDRVPRPQNEKYLVLSERERAQGFIRPLRHAYIHQDPECMGITRMSTAIAETYARQPGFYGATYCCHCHMHRPVGQDGEFTWVDPATGEDTHLFVGT